MQLLKLIELAPYAGIGQRFHAHPFLSWDRKELFFTDAVNGLPQVFTLNVERLTRHQDIGWPHYHT